MGDRPKNPEGKLRWFDRKIDDVVKRLKSLRNRRGHVLKDVLLVRRARRAGANHAWLIIRTAREKGIPVSLGFALVNQEAGGPPFRNIFGCDVGGPFCHQEVTASKVDALVRHVQAGGNSNGVGLTQLTSIGLILAAERLGGAHRIRNQLRVGFGYLAGLIDDLGRHRGIGAYNGGPGNPIESYALAVEALDRKWSGILDG